MEKINRQKYWWLSLAALVGLGSAFWQLLDKISLLKHPGSALSCNLNSVFNCSRVLTSHQYEIFGFPNAMIGIVMFTFFLTIGLVGATGSKLSARMALAAQFLGLFMLGFILWFLFESTYRIHAICLFCTIIGPAVLIINALLLRLNADILPGKRYLRRIIAAGGDIFAWSVLLLVVLFAVFMQFK